MTVWISIYRAFEGSGGGKCQAGWKLSYSCCFPTKGLFGHISCALSVLFNEFLCTWKKGKKCQTEIENKKEKT